MIFYDGIIFEMEDILLHVFNYCDPTRVVLVKGVSRLWRLAFEKHLPFLTVECNSQTKNEHLKYLKRIGNIILYDISDGLHYLQNTHTIHLYLSKHVNIDYIFLKKCKKLILQGNGIYFTKENMNLPNLNELQILTYKGIEFKGLSRLKNLKKFECQRFKENYLEYLEHIECLDLKNSKFENPDFFKHLKNVREIDLSYCEVTDDFLKHLVNVRKISLCGCKRITNNGLKYLNFVHTIDLSECVLISDLSYLKDVYKINLSCCPLITDNSLKNLIGVTIIDLWGAKKVTDEGLKYLKGAQSVELAYCDITDKGLKYLKNVRRISVCCCEGITDEGLKHLKGAYRIMINGFIKISEDYI